MSTPEEDQAALDAAAAAPLIVQIDNQNIQQQSLRDQIAVKDRAANVAATGSGWKRTNPARLVLPGSTGLTPRDS